MFSLRLSSSPISIMPTVSSVCRSKFIDLNLYSFLIWVNATWLISLIFCTCLCIFQLNLKDTSCLPFSFRWIIPFSTRCFRCVIRVGLVILKPSLLIFRCSSLNLISSDMASVM